MAEYLVIFFLFFGNLTTATAIIGYFLSNQRVFFQGLMLLNFSMVLNPALKSFWGLPLSPVLAGVPGFSFPSGHAQAQTIIFGWLMLHFPRVRLPLSLLLVGMWWAMVQRGYHNYFDIAGGLSVGVTLIAAYHSILSNAKLLKQRELIVFSAILASSIMLIGVTADYSVLRSITCTAYIAGLLTAYSIFGLSILKPVARVLGLFIFLLVFFAINYLKEELGLKGVGAEITRGLILGVSLICSAELAQKILRFKS